MIVDRYKNNQELAVSPARRASVLSASATELGSVTKSLVIGSDGEITVRLADDEVDTVIPVFAGQILPVQISHFVAATASPVVALY
jgi:hypothetical protein